MKKTHMCPWWLGYTLDNPIRRLIHPADKILSPYVKEGMTVMDFGCGFGHYSIGMARLTGSAGRVISADAQQQMLNKTMKRAKKEKLDSIIEPLLCRVDSVGAPEGLDFIMACNVLHETPSFENTLREFFGCLKPGGTLYVMEPSMHGQDDTFKAELAAAGQIGYIYKTAPKLRGQMSALLLKPERE